MPHSGSSKMPKTRRKTEKEEYPVTPPPALDLNDLEFGIRSPSYNNEEFNSARSRSSYSKSSVSSVSLNVDEDEIREDNRSSNTIDDKASCPSIITQASGSAKNENALRAPNDDNDASLLNDASSSPKLENDASSQNETSSPTGNVRESSPLERENAPSSPKMDKDLRQHDDDGNGQDKDKQSTSSIRPTDGLDDKDPEPLCPTDDSLWPVFYGHLYRLFSSTYLPTEGWDYFKLIRNLIEKCPEFMPSPLDEAHALEISKSLSELNTFIVNHNTDITCLTKNLVFQYYVLQFRQKANKLVKRLNVYLYVDNGEVIIQNKFHNNENLTKMRGYCPPGPTLALQNSFEVLQENVDDEICDNNVPTVNIKNVNEHVVTGNSNRKRKNCSPEPVKKDKALKASCDKNDVTLVNNKMTTVVNNMVENAECNDMVNNNVNNNDSNNGNLEGINGVESVIINDTVAETKNDETVNNNNTQRGDNEENVVEMEEINTDTGKKYNYTIYFETCRDWETKFKTLMQSCPKLNAKHHRGNVMLISTTDPTQFRQAQKFLDNNKIPARIIDPSSLKPLKYLIRGLPLNFPPSDILEALKEVDIEPIRAAALTNRRTKQKMPLYMVCIKDTPAAKNIKLIKSISYMSVTWEVFNTKGYAQCYNCMAWGHSSHSCKLSPKCLKCGKDHRTDKCGLPKEGATLKCANCHGDHAANYRGCRFHPANKTARTATGARFNPAPPPANNPWNRNKITQNTSNDNENHNPQVSINENQGDNMDTLEEDISPTPQNEVVESHRQGNSNHEEQADSINTRSEEIRTDPIKELEPFQNIIMDLYDRDEVIILRRDPFKDKYIRLDRPDAEASVIRNASGQVMKNADVGSVFPFDRLNEREKEVKNVNNSRDKKKATKNKNKANIANNDNNTNQVEANQGEENNSGMADFVNLLKQAREWLAYLKSLNIMNIFKELSNTFHSNLDPMEKMYNACKIITEAAERLLV